MAASSWAQQRDEANMRIFALTTTEAMMLSSSHDRCSSIGRGHIRIRVGLNTAYVLAKAGMDGSAIYCNFLHCLCTKEKILTNSVSKTFGCN